MPNVVTLSADEQAVVDAFWWQRIYFDGTPLRRWEVVPLLAATPGVSEDVAFAILLTAPAADASLVYFAGDGLDPDGQWITISHQHAHTDKSGKLDAGGSPHIRKMLGQESVGDKVRGAVGKVGKIAKNIGKAAGRAEQGLTDAVERGSDKAYNYLKDKGKAAAAKGKELAAKYGPVAKEKLKAGAKAGAKAVGKGAVAAAKAGVKVGGAAAKKVGGAIKSGMSWLWKKLKEKTVGKPKSVDEKIKDAKNQIREKRKEGKLDRLNKHLESLSGKGGPAPAKAEKSKDISAAPAKKSGGGGGGGGGGDSFHERMKAAKAAKSSGGSKPSAPKSSPKKGDDDDAASRMPWEKSTKSNPKKPTKPDMGSEADNMPWEKAKK